MLRFMLAGDAHESALAPFNKQPFPQAGRVGGLPAHARVVPRMPMKLSPGNYVGSLEYLPEAAFPGVSQVLPECEGKEQSKREQAGVPAVPAQLPERTALVNPLRKPVVKPLVVQPSGLQL